MQKEYADGSVSPTELLAKGAELEEIIDALKLAEVASVLVRPLTGGRALRFRKRGQQANPHVEKKRKKERKRAKKSRQKNRGKRGG